MGIAGFPQEFADRAATILGHGLEVSVTMRQAGVSVRAGSSTEAAAALRPGRGARRPRPVHRRDGPRRTSRHRVRGGRPGWERWSRQCVEEGFVTAAAVPAAVTADVAVALNLYSRAPDPGRRSS